ncbi:MarR family transcriptional regulator [Lentzea guizhouensis]|uniref:MarR family transcriptional regulator n=1 Tax=Lentzea guizhouensis TaxID=1586287 RepID=A0A1B2HW66_9PSEU|nr:MarR family transcriptional regulator [Lentzea guizhouensis]ANZ41979.1 MarR family transcriptional regulator [Lentzea guizhouensis]
MTARTASDLLLQLQLLGRDIELEAAKRLEQAGTSLRVVSVLMCADQHEKTQGELAELACLDKSTMVHTVDALERDGLASRKPSQTDRRARVVEVTDSGRDLVSSTEPVLADLYDAVLARLPEEDREQFLRSLNTLVAGRSLEPVVTVERAPRRRSAR